MLKKYFIISLLAFNLLLVPASQVYAQTDLSQKTVQDIAKKSGYETSGVTSATLSQTIGRIIKIVLGLLGTIFLALTVYAGVLWLTAAGNEEQVTKSLGILKTAVIGLIIIIAAYSITSFVLTNAFALAASNSQEALEQLNAAAGASGANIAGAGPTDPRVIAAIIIRSALALIGIVFVVLTLYAGWLWMTAGGEEEKISKAKKLLSNGVIGLAIILSAYSITYFIFKSVLGTAGSYANPFGYGGTSNVTNYGPNPANYSPYTY